MSDLVGYTATAKAGTLQVRVTVTVDTQLLKRALLYDIVDQLKDRQATSNSKTDFFQVISFMIEQYGASSLIDHRNTPEYQAVDGGSERVLQLVHETWISFFPDGPPEKVSFDLAISLTLEDMVVALAYAWIDGRTEEPEESDMSGLSAEQTLSYVICCCIDVGSAHLENSFTELALEDLGVCETVIQRHFGFIEAKHEFEVSIGLDDVSNPLSD